MIVTSKAFVFASVASEVGMCINARTWSVSIMTSYEVVEKTTQLLDSSLCYNRPLRVVANCHVISWHRLQQQQKRQCNKHRRVNWTKRSYAHVVHSGVEDQVGQFAEGVERPEAFLGQSQWHCQLSSRSSLRYRRGHVLRTRERDYFTCLAVKIHYGARDIVTKVESGVATEGQPYATHTRIPLLCAFARREQYFSRTKETREGRRRLLQHSQPTQRGMISPAPQVFVKEVLRAANAGSSKWTAVKPHGPRTSV